MGSWRQSEYALLETGKAECGGHRGLKERNRCPHLKGCVQYTVISTGKMGLRLEYFRLTFSLQDFNN